MAGGGGGGVEGRAQVVLAKSEVQVVHKVLMICVWFSGTEMRFKKHNSLEKR